MKKSISNGDKIRSEKLVNLTRNIRNKRKAKNRVRRLLKSIRKNGKGKSIYTRKSKNNLRKGDRLRYSKIEVT